MREFWESVRGWSETQEQAHYDDWALRYMTCSRRGCRRRRECLGEGLETRCPALRAIPLRPDERELHKLLLRAIFQQVVDDDDREDREVVAVEKKWREEKKKARLTLAWERAKAAVNTKRHGEVTNRLEL